MITGKENNADVLFSLVGDEPVTVKTAMGIPMVSRCVNMIAGAVAMLPIKLYRRTEDGVEEITEDRRLDILNRDTGDTMNADYMRAAWVRDLLLTGSAYAYIEHRHSMPYKLYYLKAEDVGRVVNRIDPIHKSYRYSVGGVMVEPWQMLKILRATDGYGGGRGVLDDSPEILGTAYGLIKYQRKQISNGGAKRGILRTNGMKKDIIAEIKAKWAAMWGAKNDNDSMFVINAADADFKELSSTSVDMQLNQTQETIDKELMKLFGTSDGLLSEDTVKNAVLPVLDMIEAALDSDLLLEREKADHYFAFDTRELTRGDISQRYSAYATALSQNFLQLDEVRAMEDLPPLGINFVKLGLNDVLLDPETGMIYTPNTNQYATMGESAEIPLTDEGNSGKIEREIRARVYKRRKNGQFDFSHNAKLLPGEHTKITSEIVSGHPDLEVGYVGTIESSFHDVQKFYAYEVLGKGDYRFIYAIVTQSKNRRECNKKWINTIREGVDKWNSV